MDHSGDGIHVGIPFDQVGRAVHSGVLTILGKTEVGARRVDCPSYRSIHWGTIETNGLTPTTSCRARN